MTYLSRLILEVHQWQRQRILSDAQHLHSFLLQAFPTFAPEGPKARQAAGLLYRLEALPQAPQLVRIIVQSHLRPDWSRLPSDWFGPDLDGRGNPSLREIGGEYAQIERGQRFAFRLRANPTKRLMLEAHERGEQRLGQRVALLKEHEQLAWLERKGQQHGFFLLSNPFEPMIKEVQVRQQANEYGSKAGKRLTFGVVIFEGRLEVSDADAFRAALQYGIGSAKGYGFGLLSIAALVGGQQ